MTRSDSTRTALARRRGGRGLYPVKNGELQKSETKRNSAKKLPEFLEPTEIDALIRHAPNPQARLCMLLQWRAGLRISEAMALETADVHFEASPPELKVRQGKGSKDRIVPMHPELEAALRTYLDYTGTRGPILGKTRQSGNRWYTDARNQAVTNQAIPAGKFVATHTLRHSAARHWLKSGVPINVVSMWLGHSNLQTTLVYLKLVSDPGGYMERVP